MTAAAISANPPIGNPWGRRAAGLLAVVGLVATGLLAVANPMDPATDSALDLAGDLAFAVSLVAFVLSGWVIVARRPDNSIGWLLLIPGVVMPVAELTSSWLSASGPPAALTPALWLLLWAGSWSWVVLAFGIFHLLLIFPTGHLLTPRWRWAVAVEVVLILTVMVVNGIDERIGPLVDGESTWSVVNPLALVDGDVMGTAVGFVWGAGLLSICVLSAIAIVIRFRRGSTTERAQVKWPLAAAILFGAIYVLGLLTPALALRPNPFDALLGFGLAAIPVSVAIAILRYRLYDIDRVISRTLGWAIVTGLLLVVFAVLVVALQTALADVTQGDTLAVAASTLVAFALFQPLRRRVQRAVDLRFNRARYDAQATTDRFGRRLRATIELGSVHDELLGTVAVAFEPSSTALWIRREQRP